MTALPPQARAERFERCFERNYADIARYCARRTASPEDAEDAATEVFATAWRRLSDMPREPDERLWLFGIARRVLANAHRAQRRRAHLALRLSADPPPAPAPPASAGSEAATIARALAAVPARDRELLLLAGWEGLTPAEIARVLKRPAPLVSQRLSPATSTLRRTSSARSVPWRIARRGGLRSSPSAPERGPRRRLRAALARPRGFEPLTFGSVGGSSACPARPFPRGTACISAFLEMTRADTRRHARRDLFPPGSHPRVRRAGAHRRAVIPVALRPYPG